MPKAPRLATRLLEEESSSEHSYRKAKTMRNSSNLTTENTTNGSQAKHRISKITFCTCLVN